MSEQQLLEPTVVQGITLVSAMGVVVISLVTDLLVAALDPRIRAA